MLLTISPVRFYYPQEGNPVDQHLDGDNERPLFLPHTSLIVFCLSLPGLCPSLWSAWRCQTTKRRVCLVFPSSSMSSAVVFRSLCVYSRPSATSEHTVWTRLELLQAVCTLPLSAKCWLFTFQIWGSWHKADKHFLISFPSPPLLGYIRPFLFRPPSQVGLFRKSGVKSRIQALRQQCELSPDFVSYEDQSAYDVADMVKQFFRDLPEPLLTSKLGETFLHIYQCKSPRSNGRCHMSSQLESCASEDVQLALVGVQSANCVSAANAIIFYYHEMYQQEILDTIWNCFR